MSGRRPTGKFFIFLILVFGAVAFLVINVLRPATQHYELVLSETASDMRSVQAVVIRREQAFSMDSNSTLLFVAGEGAALSPGDEIAYIYSAGYSVKQMSKLESIRQEIRDYQTELLAEIVDAELDRLNEAVNESALQLKNVMNERASGSVIGVVAQLTAAMDARSSHLSQNSREDTRLTTLYENEQKQQSTILSWRTVETAQTAGVVSFYLDGYENYLGPSNLGELTFDTMRLVLAGKPLSTETSRLTTPIYRMVDEREWYLAVLVSDASLNPVNGQTFFFQMEGFEDLVYQCVVESVLKQGNERLIVLRAQTPIGPLLSQRTGAGTVSAEVTGLRVPTKALVTESGQYGVRRYDGVGNTFVPVEIIQNRSGSVMIRPIAEGALMEGDYVLVG